MAITLVTKLAVALAFASPLAAAPFVSEISAGRAEAPVAELVELASGTMPYRAAGEFTRAGRPVTAPLARVGVTVPLAIMKHQVAAADYRRCVDAGACKPLAAAAGAEPDRPVVGVSWRDAEAYAAWFSRVTGERWRLPTDTEWAFVAGSRFSDDGDVVDADDPSRRALARYTREAALKDDGEERGVMPFGSFGTNEHGISDLAGNVWEWTATCYVRTALDDAGAAIAATTNCGVRIAEGRHRAYVTDFVRDARAGGCAAGVPPTHLGFRLVREQATWGSWLMARITAWRAG
ncbi:SUMF1/EgtB/PvdO family nonheme iron enzyme [Xanthobacteraceae bacterium Astr-EGSB]|uniref:formylglycine-generating enzyme family protein n=1 Tax=Astrobacterium formosum TaxID=3069710 RepID=UPI0027B713A0|nr:SUMF1/EgtB/PvdO family nonheme iron enzyme [Xanthobacteraceae bacterium Astr-EGSB]